MVCTKLPQGGDCTSRKRKICRGIRFIEVERRDGGGTEGWSSGDGGERREWSD